VQLKRFEYSGAQRYKMFRPVRFPLEGLDLRDLGSFTEKEQSQEEQPPIAVSTPPIYDLLAVSSHWGSADAGHCFSHTRSLQDGCWRVQDDTTVRVVLNEDVEENMICAYVLFYIRRDHRPNSWGVPTASSPISN
jgi:ubiquitin C-terminal hydrolase